MKIRTVGYLTKEGILGIWKNRLMSIASIGTIVLCLTILGLSYSIVSNVEHLLEQVESTIGVTAYIDPTLEEEEISSLKSEIEKIPNVVLVNYISKEEAFKSFSSDPELGDVMEQFKEDNPLPASFDIKMDNLENQEKIVKVLSQYEELELSYLKTETSMLIQLNKSISWFSTVIILSLIFVGILLMSNTIKLTVYVRRREIGIMKYIGATDWFIRAPFVIEGITIGLIGAIIPIILLWTTYSGITNMINEKLASVMRNVTLQDVSVIVYNFIPISLAIGISIGAIGSGIAIRKHLKV